MLRLFKEQLPAKGRWTDRPQAAWGDLGLFWATDLYQKGLDGLVSET